MEKIKGGLGDNKNIKDIAKYWFLKQKNNIKNYQIILNELKEQMLLGIEVEKEHSNNIRFVLEIVKDHLMEDKEYYKKLKKIEN